MHEQVGQVRLVWGDVLVSCQTTQALFEEVHSQWVHATDHHVDSKVEFQLVNQEWFMHVTLDNVVLVWDEVFQTPGQEDPFSLARRFWLNNESLPTGFPFGISFKLLPKITELRRQEPSLRDKLIIVGVSL